MINFIPIIALILGMGMAYLILRLIFRMFVRWTVRLGLLLLIFGGAVWIILRGVT